MPIFGQVWLWSLLAFLLGALLCWVLVVLPVRRRIDALERRLATIRTEPTPPYERTSAVEPEYPRASPGIVPGFGELDSQDEIRAESLTRAYALPGWDTPQQPADEAEERGSLRLSPEERAPQDATAYIGSRGGSPLTAPRTPVDEPPPAGERDWFDDVPEAQPPQPPQPQGDHHLVDDQDDVEETGTIFTQRTMPIPAETIRQLDESAPAHAAPAHAAPAHAAPAHAAAPEDSVVDDSLVDDLDDLEDAEDVEEEPPATIREPVEHPEPATDPSTNILFTANGAAPAVAEQEPAPPPAPEPEPVPEPMPVAKQQQDDRITLVTQAPQRHTLTEVEPKVVQGVTVQPERTQSLLPKRVPAKPQHRVPFGVQTTSQAVTTAGSERMRSLFEPVIPAEDEAAVPPPPHRLHSTDSRPSAPGPFGPGSAMPLPGGASPSPEFTIKASVTALRYCTPESPQFGRTVAEVWFRSAADAERVGFRPVG